MLLPTIAVLGGLALLVWSADRFVEGAASTASFIGMPPLLIGMVIVGFGTSAPEMVVSGLAAYNGNPGIGLGNAYGSNISNIALILGITGLVTPIIVNSQVIKRELPVHLGVIALTAVLLWDEEVSRADALTLLAVFGVIMSWTIWRGFKDHRNDPEESEESDTEPMSIGKSIFLLLSGLIILMGSSRGLVWGAVEIAQEFGVSDLIIGLTIIAIGTSLPELASTIIATRKGQHDIAIGNVLGSNLFNTLTVVGIAGAIHPMNVGPDILSRDILLMTVLTLSLFVFGYGFGGKQGSISRINGGLLLLCYVAYSGYLISTVFSGS
ncbi:MAG: calcium/sodium antiporter [Myxococcota bacterium]|nr:calcium/sodium antiporter [Myxococcota bacterium]